MASVVMATGLPRATDIPSADITLLASSPALVVQKDLHPALVSLLTHAASVNSKPGFDSSGEPILFFRAGQFPHGNDSEYEIDPDSRAYYKSGELPSILRAVGPLNASLGIPFWVTAFAFSNTTKIILLAIPILSITIPLSRFLPLPNGNRFVPLEELILAVLPRLYRGVEVVRAHTFRVTRSGNVDFPEEGAGVREVAQSRLALVGEPSRHVVVGRVLPGGHRR